MPLLRASKPIDDDGRKIILTKAAKSVSPGAAPHPLHKYKNPEIRSRIKPAGLCAVANVQIDKDE
jgi:hypothetical protein